MTREERAAETREIVEACRADIIRRYGLPLAASDAVVRLYLLRFARETLGAR